MQKVARNIPDVVKKVSLVLVLVPLCLAASASIAQDASVQASAAGSPATANAKALTYDAVSIRPNKSGSGNVQWRMTPDGFRMENVSLVNVVMDAYGTKTSMEDQVVGIPGWAKDAHFDMEAKVSEEDAPAYEKLTEAERKQMMQALLADRFHLKAHTETREAPIYALVVAKGGLKIKAATAGDTYEQGLKFNGKPAGPGSMMMSFTGNVQHAQYQSYSVDLFARNLTYQVHRQVLDETGLTGKYDFKLDWAPDGANEEKDAAPGIFTAIEEQLGLKLESRKGPVDFVVIDHVEQPSEN
jgi:uncharacterized protein (TIGR03435 family)